ncbi:MAG: porin family protein [Bacteroidota bacterium]
MLSKISFSQRFKAGIIGGFTTSQVSGDQLAGFNKSGFEFGGLVATPISQKFDLSFQIVFIQKGSKKPVSLDPNDIKYYRLNLNYFEVPLLFHYNFSKKIQFEMGPALGKLVSSKEEDEYGDVPAPKPFKPFDLSLMLGISYQLLPSFYLNLEGSNSILEIRTPPSEGYYSYLNRLQYNSVLMFSFKYIFHKKSEASQ